MKILFCVGSLEKGGAERVISNLANSFIKENEVSIVTTIDKIEYELNNNITLYSLDNKNTKKSKFNKLVRVKKLYKIINEINPDIIVSFLREPTFRILLLRRFINIPIIVSVRNDPKILFKKTRNMILMKLLYPLADGFVFQTEQAKMFFSDKIQKKSTIIPNPIKREFLERKPFKGEKEKIIVAVGRLEKQKNHELLIDAFYDINEEIKDYKLIIYGEGTLRSNLEEKIRYFGMQNRILLPGIVDNIPEKIENSKLFIMSSDYEGMPNALMEAMALGLVCISTDCPCGGPKFLIDDTKNGFLFKVGDKIELTNIIKKILLEFPLNKTKKIAENAKKTTIKLNEKNINKLWYNYICNVLEK